jgi:glutathione-regulated potassium-efflux system ancillary protein KefG
MKYSCRIFLMPLVRTEELIDANDVAHLLGLSHRNSVSTYLRKYDVMPRPVIDLGPKRPRLWLRPEIEAWVQQRQPVRRGRPRESSTTPATRSAASPGDNAPPLGGRRQRGGRKARPA